MTTFNVNSQIQMFQKPKYMNPFEHLKIFVSFSMLIVLMPLVEDLLVNIASEKVNPLLYQIILQKHFHIEMYPAKKYIFKANNKTTRNRCKICSPNKDTRARSIMC